MLFNSKTKKIFVIIYLFICFLVPSKEFEVIEFPMNGPITKCVIHFRFGQELFFLKLKNYHHCICVMVRNKDCLYKLLLLNVQARNLFKLWYLNHQEIP